MLRPIEGVVGRRRYDALRVRFFRNGSVGTAAVWSVTTRRPAIPRGYDARAEIDVGSRGVGSMAKTDVKVPTVGPLSQGDHDVLSAALEAAREKGLAFSRTLESFESDVRRLAARHLAGLEVEPSAERVSRYVGSAALEDLVLACACEAGDGGAWAAFDQLYRDRLTGFAVRRGLAGSNADAVVSDVIGDLFAPPTRGGTRSVLGTYDGSGSLFGWLSIVVLRRIAGAARARKPQSLDALDESGVAKHTALRPGVTSPPTPDDLVHRDEVTARFASAFDVAWQGLSGQERLALVAKHRDGLTQRRAGEYLGVGEARASRIVAAGVGKLMESLRNSGFPGGGESDPDVLSSLAAAIGRRLASFGPVERPSIAKTPIAGTAGRRPPEGGSATSVPGRVRQP